MCYHFTNKPNFNREFSHLIIDLMDIDLRKSLVYHGLVERTSFISLLILNTKTCMNYITIVTILVTLNPNVEG